LLAVCKKGHVWAWGANDYDQLGVETDEKFISNPIKLDNTLYEGDVMRAVSAGNKHSAGISVEGMCYEWGKQHARDEACLSPPCKSAYHAKASPMYAAVRFQRVCCGSTFTVSLDTQGRVWSQGVGPIGEMGLGRLRISDISKHIEGFPAGVLISEISCGRNNCGAITTQGDVYVWGRRHIDPPQHCGRNGLRVLSAASCVFDDTPVCIKKMQRFSTQAEMAFLMGSVNTLNIGPSRLADIPSEIFECILRPPR
jgi:alpha-tubulin suppressor-like RCC1 family protein